MYECTCAGRAGQGQATSRAVRPAATGSFEVWSCGPCRRGGDRGRGRGGDRGRDRGGDRGRGRGGGRDRDRGRATRRKYEPGAIRRGLKPPARSQDVHLRGQGRRDSPPSTSLAQARLFRCGPRLQPPGAWFAENDGNPGCSAEATARRTLRNDLTGTSFACTGAAAVRAAGSPRRATRPAPSAAHKPPRPASRAGRAPPAIESRHQRASSQKLKGSWRNETRS